MKKLNNLEINSEMLIKNDELVTLRGGYDVDCSGIYCHSDSDCCPSNPDCDYGPGFPTHKICLSP